MQRESVRRGFSVSNQKVALEIDFSGALQVRTTVKRKIIESPNIHVVSRGLQNLLSLLTNLTFGLFISIRVNAVSQPV